MDKKSPEYQEYKKHRRAFFWMGDVSKWAQHKATCSVCSGYTQLTRSAGD